MLRIIINADDFGISSVVNATIHACLKEGLISSATIMANGCAWEEACARTADHPNSSFGVHLNATQFAPLTGSSGLERYLLEDGSFGGQFRRGARLRDTQRVAEEWSAQVQRIIDAGVRVSHLDSHHHAHTAPGALFALKEVQRRFGIKRVRITRNVIPLSEAGRGTKLLTKWAWLQALRKIRPSATTVDYFGSVGDLAISLLQEQRQFPVGCTIEGMCHPGSESQEYQNEVEILRNRCFDASHQHWELISYNDL